MRKIIIPLLFICSMGFGQMFSAQNAESAEDLGDSAIRIGTQVWAKYNLAVTNYNDNTGIPKVTDNAAWAALTTPAYCWYGNDSATYSATYGALYNWYAVNTEKLCPTGWHVPDSTELNTLITYLGGQSGAGGKLKEVGTTHWYTPNTGADNSSGFTALPSGSRMNTDSFSGTYNTQAFYWNSTSISDNGYYYLISYNTKSLSKSSISKKYGFSVRCIKD